MKSTIYFQDEAGALATLEGVTDWDALCSRMRFRDKCLDFREINGCVYEFETVEVSSARGDSVAAMVSLRTVEQANRPFLLETMPPLLDTGKRTVHELSNEQREDGPVMDEMYIWWGSDHAVKKACKHLIGAWERWKTAHPDSDAYAVPVSGGADLTEEVARRLREVGYDAEMTPTTVGGEPSYPLVTFRRVKP